MPASSLPLPSRDEFQLDPDLAFLNHGSYGAVPTVVQEQFEQLERQMERNPVEWLGRRVDALLAESRAALGSFVGADPDDLVYFPNPTTAINMVVRSLRLQPGDQIVTTDHEYGAMSRTWRKWSAEEGIEVVAVPVPLPVDDPANVVERVWSAVGPRTRVLFISHLTSATALVFPVAELCRRARAAGVLAIVDGAHVPGQRSLDLATIECDFYTGALHKWLCTPKGCAFLWVRREQQEWLQPLVTSWGWESERPSGSRFIDWHQYQGTRDMSAALSVPASIEFVKAHDWSGAQERGHRLALDARERINALTGLEAICPPTHEWLGQMTSVRLPDVDVAALQTRLFDRHRVEIPCHRWGDIPLIRVSGGVHTTEHDIDRLVAALEDELG